MSKLQPIASMTASESALAKKHKIITEKPNITTNKQKIITKKPKIIIIPVEELLMGKKQTVDNPVKPCHKRGLPELDNAGNQKRQKLDHSMPPCLQGFLKEIGVNYREKEGRIEWDMDPFAEDILLQLTSIARFLGARAGKGYHKEDSTNLEQKKEILQKKQREAENRKKQEEEKEAEQKLQRQREREAARHAVQKIVKCVEFDDNAKVLEDFLLLSRCPFDEQYHGFNMGQWRQILKMKENEDQEEGEIRE